MVKRTIKKVAREGQKYDKLCFHMPLEKVKKYFGKGMTRIKVFDQKWMRPRSLIEIDGITYLDEWPSLRIEKITGGELKCHVFTRKGTPETNDWRITRYSAG